MKIRKYMVQVEVPASVSEKELREYILDAIQCWGGQFHPDNDLFNLRGRVKVTCHVDNHKGKT